MVTLRKLTSTEWRALAQGQRALAVQAEQDRNRHASTTVEAQFESARRTHLELAEQCEARATLLDERTSVQNAAPADTT